MAIAAVAGYTRPMKSVAILAFPGVVAADLTTPCEVFGRARTAQGARAYEVRVCGSAPEVETEHFRLGAPFDLRAAEDAAIVVVPGLGEGEAVPAAVLDTIRAAVARGATVASICTGAFVLAAAGVLDGLRATTHWLAAEELRRRHPRVTVDPNVLFVDNGQILTSAGAAAGIDLCLHLVRRDLGSAAAADVARKSVVPLEREGGQAQFIATPPVAPDGTALQPLLAWIEAHCERPLAIADLAGRAGLSERSLHRRFREQTGYAPLQWLLRARVRRAQALLETSAHPMEYIAERAGFGSVTAFREQFRKTTMTSPAAYRRAFQRAVG